MKNDSMLATVLSKFKQSAPGVVETPVDAVAPEALAELQAALEAKTAEADHLSAALEAALAAVAEADAKVAAADAVVAQAAADAQAAAALAAEQAATAALEAEAAKQASRLTRVEAAVGTVKAPALMAATSTLDDAAFDAVVSAMTASVDSEAKSEKFVEQGVSAEVDASKVEEVSGVMKAVRAQFPQGSAK